MTIDTHTVEKGVLSGKAIPTIATLLGGVLIAGMLGITIAADKVLAPVPSIASFAPGDQSQVPITAREARPRGIVEVTVAPLQSVDGVLREVVSLVRGTSDISGSVGSQTTLAPAPTQPAIAPSSVKASDRKTLSASKPRKDTRRSGEKVETTATAGALEAEWPAGPGNRKSAKGRSKGK